MWTSPDFLVGNNRKCMQSDLCKIGIPTLLTGQPGAALTSGSGIQKPLALCPHRPLWSAGPVRGRTTMKTQFVPLSQARWLGRGLLAYVAEASGQTPPSLPPQSQSGSRVERAGRPFHPGGTLYSKWEHGPLPVQQLPSHPVGNTVKATSKRTVRPWEPRQLLSQENS